MNNYKLYALRSDILTLVGKYGVTPAEAYFVLSKVVNEVESAYLEQVQKEIELEKNKQEDNKEETQVINIGAEDLINGPVEIPIEASWLNQDALFYLGGSALSHLRVFHIN